MKKIIANRIIWITLLALIIFASFSIVVMNFVNVRMMSENLTEIHTIYRHAIEDSSSEAVMQDTINKLAPRLNIAVTNLNGNVIAGSNAEQVGVDNYSDERFFKSAINDNPKIIISTAARYGRQNVVFAQKFHCKGGIMRDVVLIVAMPIDYNNTLFIIMVPVMGVVIVVVILLTAGISNTLVTNAISPLSDIQKHLENINRGEYKRVESSTKYQEVQRVVNEINTISSKIGNNMKTLEYERQKSRFIIDNMSQGIVALSRNNNILLTNKASLSILGATKNLLNSNLSELIDDSEIIDKILESIATGTSSIFEHKLGDNYYRLEIICMANIDNREDREIETLIAFTNITSEITSAQVRSEFFANASHELRTPLTAIKGFTELYSLNNNPKQREEFIATIGKNADRVLELIEDMLKLARAEADVVDENISYIDLREMADSIISKLDSLAEPRHITLKCTGKGDMYGSPKQIEEVLTNLIDNAIKYNVDGGSVNVVIDSKAKHVKLTVADTGIGMESKYQPRIFERYYRIDKGRDRKVKSTGLGLAIVKHIVLSHSGTIELESKPNVGTKFTLVFPNAKTACECE